MPGEETKHEPAGMQTQGLYNPSVTQLHFTPVQYANYGPMLQAIENAGSNILHYMNPSTIAQMKMDVASSNAGRQFLKDAQTQGLLTGMGYVQGGKFGVQAPFQNPYWRMGGGGTPQGGTPQNTNQQQPVQQQPVQQQPQQTQTPVDKQTQTYVSGDGSTRTGDFNVGPIVPTTNYQTGGEVEPAPQVQPQQPAPQYFSSPNAIPPPPIPAQQQSPQASALPAHIPYSPESQAQAFTPQQGAGVLSPQALAQQQAQRQLEQQNLTQWQNASQGGVLSAEEARNWARSNMDTDISRAVYLPQGGPPGANGQREPAYAFYGKKGGQNIVPISQMVKAGAGPLVAAQNFSQVLSHNDQANQPQADGQAAGPPGGAVSPRPASPNQPPSPVPGGGPPAAPGGQPPGSQVPQLPGGGTNWGAIPGQLPQDQMNQQIAAATNTPQTGGPPVTSLIAGTNTAGGVPQNTNPPNINVQTGEGAVDSANDKGASVQKETGISQSQIDQDKLNYQQNGAQETDRYTGDPVIRHLGNYTEYLSQQGKGPAYFARPGQGGFYEDVMWQGDTGWHQRLPPEQKMRQDLLDSPYGNVVGGYDAIKNMDGPTLQKHLRTWFYLNNVLPNEQALPSGDSAQLRSLREDILGGTRLQHIMAGQDPANFSFYNQGENQKLKNLTGSLVPQEHGINDWIHNRLVQLQKIPYGNRQFDPRVDAATTEYDALLHRENGLAPDAPMTPEQRTNADQQFGIGSGNPSGAATLQRWINGKKEQFQQLVNTGIANRQRLPHDYLDMNDAISTNTPWLDTRDAYAPKNAGPNAPVGDNTKAAIVHSNQKSTYTPSPTPAPSAPMGTQQGSSKANAYTANTNSQYQQMLNDPKIPPEAWITDGNGKFIQKQRALQNH